MMIKNLNSYNQTIKILSKPGERAIFREKNSCCVVVGLRLIKKPHFYQDVYTPGNYEHGRHPQPVRMKRSF
jgi:hypothetical protein